MSRSLSSTAVAALAAQETTALLITLLEIDHDDLSEPFYVSNNRETVTYDGNDYLPYPFDIAFPVESEDRPASVKLTFDNSDRLLVETIRSISTPPSVAMAIVLNGSPPTLEVGPFPFIMQSVDYDATKIVATLTYTAMLDEVFPSARFTPTNYPGIFGGLPPGVDWDPGGDRDSVLSEQLRVFGEPAYSGYQKRRRRRGN